MASPKPCSSFGPLDAHVHHPGAQEDAADGDEDVPPRQCGIARGVDRVVRLEDRGEVRQLEDPFDGGTRAGQAQRPARALRARVAADERTNAGAVDRGHAGQIDDEMAMAAANELAQPAFEGFRRTARQQRLARGQQQPVADRLRFAGCGHPRYRLPAIWQPELLVNGCSCSL